MGKAVDEERHARARAAEIAGMVPQVLAGDAIERAQTGSRPDRVDGRLLGRENQLMQRPLARGKAARGRDVLVMSAL
jgi:hypothetical protein